MRTKEQETKKHIAFFLPGLYDGGAERVMLNLAEGLALLGFEVDLVLAQAEGPYLDQVSKSVRLIELNSRHLSSQRTLLSLPALIRYIRSERPNVMLSGLNYANIVALWAKRLARVPFRLVISEHNTFSSESTQLNRIHRSILYVLMKSTYPKADQIIAVSEGVADDLSCVFKLPRNHIKVIYNPIITPELKTKKDAPLEDPWFGSDQPPVILAVGRLTKQKGFDVLIRAFAQVRKQCNSRLLILGEGEERQALMNLVIELNIIEDVRLPGFIINPYPYMANASMFVLSSRWEGLPTVLVEALYCGIPLIATDCPSGPREILNNGKYGELVPVDNIGCLEHAIVSVLNGEIQTISPSWWQAYELNAVIEQYIETLFGKV